MEEKIVRVFLRRYEKIGYKGGIAKVIFDDEFEDMAHEIVKLFSIPYVSKRTFNTLESIDKDTKVLIERVSQDNYVMNEQDNREIKMRIDALKSVLYGC